jgi:aminopeptidase C
MELSGIAGTLQREFNLNSEEYSSVDKLGMAEALHKEANRELQSLLRLDLHEDAYLLKNLREAQKNYRFGSLLLEEVRETDLEAYDSWANA